MEAKQQTFRLLAEWVPAEKSVLPPDAPREQAVALLVARYITGHGPATAADLARWCDIPKREAAAVSSKDRELDKEFLARQAVEVQFAACDCGQDLGQCDLDEPDLVDCEFVAAVGHVLLLCG